jgi:transposase-like protein
MFTKELTEAFPKVVETLHEKLEDSLLFFAFPKFAAKRIYSTTMQDRLHKEVRSCSRVEAIFLGIEMLLRLVTTYQIEYSDDWAATRVYIYPKYIENKEAERKKAA